MQAGLKLGNDNHELRPLVEPVQLSLTFDSLVPLNLNQCVYLGKLQLNMFHDFTLIYVFVESMYVHTVGGL